MKNHLQFSQLLILAVCVFFLSCGNDKLTRDKAQTLISEKLNLPAAEYRRLIIDDNSLASHMTRQRLSAFQNVGLLTISESPSFMSTRVQGTLTNEGEKYMLPGSMVETSMYESGNIKVRIRSVDVNTITGIVLPKEEEGKSTNAKVEFTLKTYDYTPFGDIMITNKAEEFSGEAELTKYDDGWRISKINCKNIDEDNLISVKNIPLQSQSGDKNTNPSSSEPTAEKAIVSAPPANEDNSSNEQFKKHSPCPYFSVKLPTSFKLNKMYDEATPDACDYEVKLSDGFSIIEIHSLISSRFDAQTIAEFYNKALAGSELNISLKTKNQNWFVISGTKKDNGNIVYWKRVLGDNFVSDLHIEYPPSRKEQIEQYIGEIAKSFISQ